MTNRLQEVRLLLELTQPQVSEKLKGVEPRADVGMVSRYEKGVCLPTKDQLTELEKLYGVPRTELYDPEDLDLLDMPGDLPALTAGAHTGAPLHISQGGNEENERKTTAPPPSHVGRIRKCYRVSREFAESLPDDLLQVCGYSSWQSWHDAALKRLLGEYAARCKAAKKGGKTA